MIYVYALTDYIDIQFNDNDVRVVEYGENLEFRTNHIANGKIIFKVPTDKLFEVIELHKKYIKEDN